MNNRYKDFTKQWLIDNKIHVVLDGVDTFGLSTKDLWKNYEYAEIYQENKWGNLVLKVPQPNKKPHDKGILKECTYYQIGITCGVKGQRKTIGIPVHRIIYAWFNDIIYAYNDKGEKMDICHINKPTSNNHINNLKWDTHRNNINERTGATNQYGKTKNWKLEGTDE